MAAKKHNWGKIDYPPKATHDDDRAATTGKSAKTEATERKTTEEHPRPRSTEEKSDR